MSPRYIGDMAKKDLINILENLTDLDTKKLISDILKDKSISDTEKEEIISDILLSNDSSENKQHEDDVFSDKMQTEEKIEDFSSFLLFDTESNTSVFLKSEKAVMDYIISRSLSLKQVVVYRKQKVRLSLESSN